MKFLEYKLTLDRSRKIVKKELTERGHVMISDLDAAEMNLSSLDTKLFYEKEPTKPDEVEEEKKPKIKK